MSCAAAEETKDYASTLYRFLGNRRYRVPTHWLWPAANALGPGTFHVKLRCLRITDRLVRKVNMRSADRGRFDRDLIFREFHDVYPTGDDGRFGRCRNFSFLGPYPQDRGSVEVSDFPWPI